MDSKALDHVFAPTSIAVVGASAQAGTIGGRCLQYLASHGFGGALYPVNPRYESIAGLRCYPDVASIPGHVDQVILAVSQRLALPALEQAAARGVRSAVLFSSGFAEAGPEGQAAERRLREIAAAHDIRLIGPNCTGYVNATAGVWATFSSLGDLPDLGGPGAAFLSQSGALGGSLANRARDRGLGISHLVSTGNEADLGIGHLLEWLADADDVRVIAGFVEGIHDAPAFVRGLAAAQRQRKPVVLMKVGAAKTAAAAAASHTGALVGDDTVYDALFRQYNVIRVEDTEELTDVALLASCQPAAEGIGLLTTSGGVGSLMAYQADQLGLTLSPVSEGTRAELRAVLPAFGAVNNPLDTTAQAINDPDLYLKTALAFAREPAFGLVICAVTTAAGAVAERYARDIMRVAAETGKPVLSVWTAGSLSEPGVRLLRQAGLPVYDTPLSCLKAVRRLLAFHRHASRPAVPPEAALPAAAVSDPAPELPAGGGVLGEREAKALLARHGLPVVREETAATAEAAAAAATAIGYPVALKIDADGLAHKTEVGGVRLGLKDAGAVRAAFAELVQGVARRRPDLQIRGVLVQAMIPPGLELVLGVRRDPQFGPLLMLGLGGIWVEVLRDVATRLVPVAPADAEAMVRELRAFPLLAGARGQKPADLAALQAAIVAMSQAAVALGPRVREIEINPLIVLPEGKGVWAADGLVIADPAEAP